MKAFELNNPLIGLQDSLKAYEIYDPLKWLQDSLNSYQAFDLTNSVSRSTGISFYQRSTDSLLDAISPDNWQTLYRDCENIQVSSDGIISLGKESVNTKELEEVVGRITKSVVDEKVGQLEKAISGILEEIRSQKTPLIKKFLFFVVLPFIINIASAMVMFSYQHRTEEALQVSKQRDVIKQIRETIILNIDDNAFLNSLGIVSANKLNVRKTASRHSAIVGSLNLGDIVQIVKKGRDWSLVQWNDGKSEADSQGWVFSRYVKKVKKRTRWNVPSVYNSAIIGDEP